MTPKQKQWMWFIGLYVGSVVLLASFSFIVRLFIPHA